MAEQRSTMIDPPIEQLLDTVDSKFTLVTLASKRGRQINSYFNQLGEGLGAIVPPQVASVARKPLSIALEEIAAGKVVAGAPKPAPGEADGAEAVPSAVAGTGDLVPGGTLAELILGTAAPGAEDVEAVLELADPGTAGAAEPAVLQVAPQPARVDAGALAGAAEAQADATVAEPGGEAE
jgi:DNA-directed RNA polymerase subunit omega